MNYLLIILINFIAFSVQANTCPYSHHSFDVEVSTKVTKAKDEYSYEYSVSNSKTSIVSVANFFLKSKEKITSPKSPNNWNPAKFSGSSTVGWSTDRKLSIKPGEFVSGYKVTSKGRPGIVKASFMGRNSITNVIYTKIKRDKMTACPGYWDYGSRGVDDPRASVMTLGPIPENQVSPTALYRLKSDEAWTGSLETSHDALRTIDPMAKGTIEVLVLGNSDIQAEDIQKSGIKFGRGNAEPKSINIIDINTTTPRYSGKALLLTFDLEQVQVLCDLDRALFLEAQASKDRRVFTGIKIKPTFCDLKNWAPEVPNILKVRAESHNE
ncbi:hypothetical protein [Bdellovibrio sp. BCCA]|uniref:hypothetical protein n=1 Tax=Bdellovibrio sp. BCCA TaxID=3136281 RepID=UPI0030F172BF